MKAINIHEAKTNLSRIVEEVAAGEEIIVAKTKPRLHFQEAGFWFKVIIYLPSTFTFHLIFTEAD